VPRSIKASAMRWCTPVRWGTLPAGGEGESLRAMGTPALAQKASTPSTAPHTLTSSAPRAGEPGGTSDHRSDRASTSDGALIEEERAESHADRAQREVALGTTAFCCTFAFPSLSRGGECPVRRDTGLPARATVAWKVRGLASLAFEWVENFDVALVSTSNEMG
jgi:hypothetical protein